MHEFSLFRCGAREAEMLEHGAKVYTHIQVSKAAKHAVVFVVLRNMQRRGLNLTQLDKLRDDQLPHTTRVFKHAGDVSHLAHEGTERIGVVAKLPSRNRT